MNDSVQVYPIESVYGVIEVKSSLSKPELFKALDNIKSVKELRPEGNRVHQMPGLIVSSERPMPFGIAFAYRLAGNSLNSLCENLKEWEAGASPEYWPNLIVVLDEGIIYHRKGFTNCIKSEEIDNRCLASYVAFEKDSLFQFYICLLDLCSGMKLEVPELRQYDNPAEKIGPYTIKNHDRSDGLKMANKVDAENIVSVWLLLKSWSPGASCTARFRKKIYF